MNENVREASTLHTAKSSSLGGGVLHNKIAQNDKKSRSAHLLHRHQHHFAVESCRSTQFHSIFHHTDAYNSHTHARYPTPPLFAVRDADFKCTRRSTSSEWHFEFQPLLKWRRFWRDSPRGGSSDSYARQPARTFEQLIFITIGMRSRWQAANSKFASRPYQVDSKLLHRHFLYYERWKNQKVQKPAMCIWTKRDVKPATYHFMVLSGIFLSFPSVSEIFWRSSARWSRIEETVINERHWKWNVLLEWKLNEKAGFSRKLTVF